MKKMLTHYICTWLAMTSMLCLADSSFYSAQAAVVNDKHPLSNCYQNVKDVLYLSDGCIVYSRYSGEDDMPLIYRSIDAIVCIDSDGRTIWECEVENAHYSVRTELIQNNEGNYVFLGQMENNCFYFSVISTNGILLTSMMLDSIAEAPTMMCDGLLYMITNQESQKKK